MDEVIDASSVLLRDNRILYDTNIWIFLEFDPGNARADKVAAYSSAHKDLIEGGNTILVNDYVLGELCNRCARIEYKRLFQDDPGMYYFKSRRRTKDFRNSMKLIRDVCAGILQQCEFVSVSGTHYSVRQTLDQFCSGRLDFTDSLLIQFCRKEGLFLMTDDRDFLNKGIPVIIHRI
jgi:hypothetical protein